MQSANLSDLIIDITIIFIVIVGGSIELYRNRQKFNSFIYGNILVGCGLLLLAGAIIILINNQLFSVDNFINVLLLKSEKGYRPTQVTFVFFSYVFFYWGLFIWGVVFFKKNKENKSNSDKK